MKNKINHKYVIRTALLTVAMALFAQISFSQATNEAQKTKLADELVEQTFKAFPIDAFQKNIEEVKSGSLGSFKTEIAKMLNGKIDESAELSTEKKAEIKSKVSPLVDKMAERVEVLVMQDLQMEQWIKESLKENYLKDLNISDMQSLTTFFNSPSGTAFFELVEEEARAEIEKRPSKSAEMLKDDDAVEIVKFMKTPPAERFLKAFARDSDNFLNAKINAWGENMIKSLEKDMESGELNKLLIEFIKENFTAK